MNRSPATKQDHGRAGGSARPGLAGQKGAHAQNAAPEPVAAPVPTEAQSEILDAIEALGALAIEDIATLLGLSKDEAEANVRRLVEGGRLVRSPGSGTIGLAQGQDAGRAGGGAPPGYLLLDRLEAALRDRGVATSAQLITAMEGRHGFRAIGRAIERLVAEGRAERQALGIYAIKGYVPTSEEIKVLNRNGKAAAASDEDLLAWLTELRSNAAIAVHLGVTPERARQRMVALLATGRVRAERPKAGGAKLYMAVPIHPPAGPIPFMTDTLEVPMIRPAQSHAGGPQASATCDTCKTEAPFYCEFERRRGKSPRVVEGQANRRLREMGWEIIKGKHICPTCVLARRGGSEAQGEVLATADVLPEVPRSLPLEAPKSPSPAADPGAGPKVAPLEPRSSPAPASEAPAPAKAAASA